MKNALLILMGLLGAGATCGAATNDAERAFASSNATEVVASASAGRGKVKGGSEVKSPASAPARDDGGAGGDAPGAAALLSLACVLAGLAGVGWCVSGVDRRVRRLDAAVADAAATAKTVLRHARGVDDIVKTVEREINEGNERLFNAVKAFVGKELAERRSAATASAPLCARPTASPAAQVPPHGLPIVAEVRERFQGLTDELSGWIERGLEGADVVASSLHVLTTVALVDDETWLMALRNVSVGLSHVSRAMGETAEENASRMARWGKSLLELSKAPEAFSISVPSVGSKIDYSWMTPVGDQGGARVSEVRSWAVYTAYGVRHNAEVV